MQKLGVLYPKGGSGELGGFRGKGGFICYLKSEEIHSRVKAAGTSDQIQCAPLLPHPEGIAQNNFFSSQHQWNIHSASDQPTQDCTMEVVKDKLAKYQS